MVHATARGHTRTVVVWVKVHPYTHPHEHHEHHEHVA